MLQCPVAPWSSWCLAWRCCWPGSPAVSCCQGWEELLMCCSLIWVWWLEFLVPDISEKLDFNIYKVDTIFRTWFSSHKTSLKCCEQIKSFVTNLEPGWSWVWVELSFTELTLRVWTGDALRRSWSVILHLVDMSHPGVILQCSSEVTNKIGLRLIFLFRKSRKS